MDREEVLRRQLLRDLDRLHRLILRYAAGEEQVRQERDRLEESVQAGFADWRALRDRRPEARGPDPDGRPSPAA